MNEFVVDAVNCNQCPLWATSISGSVRRSGIYGKGSGDNGLLIIGEALGAEEVRLGLPFIGRAGELLSRVLNEVGIDERKAYITNSVRCRPENNRTPTIEESRVCTNIHKYKDLPHPEFKPQLVVLLGLVALRNMLSLTGLTDKRGIFYDLEWSKEYKTKVMPTFHPAAVLRQPKLYEILKEDFYKVKGFLNDVSYSGLPSIVSEYINSLDRFLYWMRYLAENPDVEVTCDLETTGLSFYKEKIVSISLVFPLPDDTLQGIAFLTIPKPGWWYADLEDNDIVNFINLALCDHKMVFQNGDFDTKMLWYNGIKVDNYFDTLDAHHLIDENLPHGLKFMVTQYLPSEAGYQHEINNMIGAKGMYHTAPAEVLLNYNLKDSYYTKVLKNMFVKHLHAEGMTDFYYSHAMPLRRTLTRMSYRGILVDRERVEWLSNEYRNKIKEDEQKLFYLCQKNFNYSSPQQLASVLYNTLGLPILERTKKGFPATGKEILLQLKDQHPAIPVLLTIKHLAKMLSTYLDGRIKDDDADKSGILQYLDSNNRIHGDFLTHGTPSGRLAGRNPSLLNIPRDPQIRMNFIAAPGWKFLDFDFKQAEYVALAYFSQDPNLLEAIEGDVHERVVRQLMHFEGTITKDIKTQAKIVNYRKIFGGGPIDEEMREWYKKWDRTYGIAVAWMYDMQRQWKEKGFIQGIYGRKRRFPPAFDSQIESYYNRLCINFPCQNAVADTTNRSLFLLDAAIERIFGYSHDNIYNIPGIVLAVHDNIITEVPDELVDDMMKIKEEIMTLPLPVFNTSLKVDKHVVQRWGEDQLEQAGSGELDIIADIEEAL
jgi:uracil-DNA glycosylase family 4